MCWALLTAREFKWKCRGFCSSKSGNISQCADKVQSFIVKNEIILKNQTHQDTCSVQLPHTGTYASNVEPGSHLSRSHLLQKLTLHCCQPNHKLPSAQDLFGIKEKEMWNSKGFELSTCLTISPVGLSLHWSHCRCVNLCHLRLNSMPTEQASMLQIISSTCFRLFLEALHQSPWRTPYLTPSSPDEIPSVFHFCVLPHFSASAPQSCPSENLNTVKNYIHP